MIKPEHENMMNIKADADTVNKWFKSQISSYQRMRAYTTVRLQEELNKEKVEVVKKFTQRPSDTYFATKITDDIYVVENLIRYDGNPCTLYIPYLKNKETNYHVCYETFEYALVAAICLQNGLDETQIGVIIQMLKKLGK